jgi:hypothetical protein
LSVRWLEKEPVAEMSGKHPNLKAQKFTFGGDLIQISAAQLKSLFK